MSAIVEQLGKDGSDTGPGYAQAYALLNCANAVGCMVGPVLMGALIDRYGWRTMNIVLTIFTASGLPPAVSFSTFWTRCKSHLHSDTIHWRSTNQMKKS